MKTKLNELLEFPCSFTYKVMGLAQPELVDQVVEVVQRHAPGDYNPQVKPSSKAITTPCPSPSMPPILTRWKPYMMSWATLKLSAWCCNSSTILCFSTRARASSARVAHFESAIPK